MASSPNTGPHASEAPQPGASDFADPVAVATGVNHVWVLVALALFVLAIAVLTGLMGYPGLCAAPVLFFTLVAGLPRWLGAADAIKHRQPSDEWQRLVNEASTKLGLAHPPQAILTTEATGVRVVGAFRRKRVVIGRALHDHLNRQLLKPGRLDTRPILVYHEMHHVASLDLEMLGGLEQLLRVFSWAAVWSIVCALGAIWCLMLLTPPALELALHNPIFNGFFDHVAPAFTWLVDLQRATLTEYWHLSQTISYSLPITAVAASFAPLLAGIVLLRLFVWNRLMQLRELYADQLSAAQFDRETTRRAINQLRVGETLSGSASSSNRAHSGTWANPARLLAPFRAWAQRVFSTHPDPNTRTMALKSSANFFDALTQPRINGITVGTALLALSLLTTSGFSLPFSAIWLPFVVAITAHLTLTALMLPAPAQLKSSDASPRLRQAVLLATLIGFAWLALIALIGLTTLTVFPDAVRELIVTIYRAVLGQIERGPDQALVTLAVRDAFIRLLVLSMLGIPATLASTQFDLFLRRKFSGKFDLRASAMRVYAVPALVSTGLLVVGMALVGLVISGAVYDGLAIVAGVLCTAIGGLAWVFLRRRERRVGN